MRRSAIITVRAVTADAAPGPMIVSAEARNEDACGHCQEYTHVEVHRSDFRYCGPCTSEPPRIGTEHRIRLQHLRKRELGFCRCWKTRRRPECKGAAA